MIYFIVTTCLFDECPIRVNQYIYGINKLKQIIQTENIENCKIIIIENNGVRNTFLDKLGCDVYYTSNNFLPTKNKGIKELQDVKDCIKYYNIEDNDFIVKMTGRYILHNNSEFMRIIKNLFTTHYDCVIKYGSYLNPLDYKVENCITGLIGMRCVYVKQIETPEEDVCVECKWAKATYFIENHKIYLVNKLGIYICPGSNNYFAV